MRRRFFILLLLLPFIVVVVVTPIFLRTQTSDYKDFYLVHQWPATFCSLPNKTCNSPPINYFTIHGMWPQPHRKVRCHFDPNVMVCVYIIVLLKTYKVISLTLLLVKLIILLTPFLLWLFLFFYRAKLMVWIVVGLIYWTNHLACLFGSMNGKSMDVSLPPS